LATYAVLPLGVNATEAGSLPTLIGTLCTLPDLTLMTDTVPALKFATYAVLPLGVNATEYGRSPTMIGEVTLGAATAGAGTDTTIVNDNSARDSVRLRIIMVMPLFFR
jgi:hypothetical protein